MELDHVEIEDFRGIDRLALDLDELTTIISEPEGGKSSLLRAVGRVLQLCGKVCPGAVQDVQLRPIEQSGVDPLLIADLFRVAAIGRRRWRIEVQQPSQPRPPVDLATPVHQVVGDAVVGEDRPVPRHGVPVRIK